MENSFLIVLYEDNMISKKFEKSVKELITLFLKTEESNWEVPLERKFLTFLSSLGSFDPIIPYQWNEIHKEYNKLKTK